MNNRFLSTIAFTIILLLGALSSQAQGRFRAGIVAGLNASQINGDDSAGYNKLGFRAGLRAVTILGDRSEINFDILFSQRGSSNELNPNGTSIRFVINTNYVEVPVVFVYKDWEEADYYRIHVSGGLSYARLIGSRVEEFPPIFDEQDNFNLNNLGVKLGASYFASRNLGFSVAWTRSLLALYDSSKFANNGMPNFNKDLVDYFLSFEAVYLF